MSAEERNDTNTALTAQDDIEIKRKELNEESLTIINQVITEVDSNKAKDLTDLFNINHKKKTMMRVNKLNTLQDIMVDQAIERFSKKPGEIDNATLLQGMKTVQDMIERGQKQINDTADMPLIQINQQNNEVNLSEPSQLSRESRDKVKQAVANILAGINMPKHNDIVVEQTEEPIDD